MEDLLARYLDGDLDEAGADELLRRSREDPALAREIREYEGLLEAATGLERLRAPDGFTDRVMSALPANQAPPRRGWTAGRHGTWMAAAAGLAAGLLVGALIAGGLVPAPAGGSRAGEAGLAVLDDSGPIGPGVEFHRAVRLVYVPSRPDVRSVAVAGSFNGWDPGSTPMVRRSGDWSVVLLLPPGDHEYMIVEDGTRWITDPKAPQTRRDGFGGVNGLLDVRA